MLCMCVCTGGDRRSRCFHKRTDVSTLLIYQFFSFHFVYDCVCWGLVRVTVELGLTVRGNIGPEKTQALGNIG